MSIRQKPDITEIEPAIEKAMKLGIKYSKLQRLAKKNHVRANLGYRKIFK